MKKTNMKKSNAIKKFVGNYIWPKTTEQKVKYADMGKRMQVLSAVLVLIELAVFAAIWVKSKLDENKFIPNITTYCGSSEEENEEEKA